MKCKYEWYGKRGIFTYQVHDASTGDWFEPDTWDGIDGAAAAKATARALARGKMGDNYGIVTSRMVPVFGGDRNRGAKVPEATARGENKAALGWSCGGG